MVISTATILSSRVASTGITTDPPYPPSLKEGEDDRTKGERTGESWVLAHHIPMQCAGSCLFLIFSWLLFLCSSPPQPRPIRCAIIVLSVWGENSVAPVHNSKGPEIGRGWEEVGFQCTTYSAAHQKQTLACLSQFQVTDKFVCISKSLQSNITSLKLFQVSLQDTLFHQPFWGRFFVFFFGQIATPAKKTLDKGTYIYLFVFCNCLWNLCRTQVMLVNKILH